MKLLAGIALILCFASQSSAADCVEPQFDMPLPDGNTASREVMLSMRKTIQGYSEAVTEFTECVKKAGGNQRKQANLAVDTLEAIADRFNLQLRLFKKRIGE